MGLFNSKKEDETPKKAVKKEEEKKTVTKEEKKEAAITKGESQLAYDFIVKPWITEKAQELMSSDKYIFKLRPKTTKREAKLAVEKMYEVRVTDVNIINIPSKKKRFGRHQGMKSAVRKAVVTLKKGDKIEIFE